MEYGLFSVTFAVLCLVAVWRLPEILDVVCQLHKNGLFTSEPSTTWRFILLVALVAFCVFWLGLPALIQALKGW